MCIRDRFAIRQQNIKRFLAFSSISQAGYILLGFIGGNQLGICLLYTSPSPRDGLLSIRRQPSDVYKRQVCYSPAKYKEISRIFINFAGWIYPPWIYRWKSAWYLSLIHISEPTRRTPLYSSAAVRCV